MTSQIESDSTSQAEIRAHQAPRPNLDDRPPAFRHPEADTVSVRSAQVFAGATELAGPEEEAAPTPVPLRRAMLAVEAAVRSCVKSIATILHEAMHRGLVIVKLDSP